MSKRSIIIALLAVVLFAAAIFSVINDFKPKSETETEPEQDSGTDKFTGPRKGFYYDRVNKVYKPAKVKQELKPETETELKTELIQGPDV